jgi:hypothetical protein
LRWEQIAENSFDFVALSKDALQVLVQWVIFPGVYNPDMLIYRAKSMAEWRQ